MSRESCRVGENTLSSPARTNYEIQKKKKNLLTAGMTGSNEHDNFPFVRMNQSLDIPTG